MLYGAKTGGTRLTETRVNVMEMTCFRCTVGVTRTDRLRKEEVLRKSAIETELASRVHQRVELIREWCGPESGVDKRVVWTKEWS